MVEREVIEKTEDIIKEISGIEFYISQNNNELRVVFSNSHPQNTAKLITMLVLAILDHDALLDDFNYVIIGGHDKNKPPNEKRYKMEKVLEQLSPASS